MIDAGATVGLPEVNIGLLPGGQGTQRLPRLVGCEAALTLMTTGAHVPAAQVKETHPIPPRRGGRVGAPSGRCLHSAQQARAAASLLAQSSDLRPPGQALEWGVVDGMVEAGGDLLAAAKALCTEKMGQPVKRIYDAPAPDPDADFAGRPVASLSSRLEPPAIGLMHIHRVRAPRQNESAAIVCPAGVAKAMAKSRPGEPAPQAIVRCVQAACAGPTFDAGDQVEKAECATPQHGL